VNVQAKSLVLIIVVMAALKFFQCNAQDDIQNSAFRFSEAEFAENYSLDANDSPVLKVSKSTHFGKLQFSLQYHSGDNVDNTLYPQSGFASFEQVGLTPQLTLFTTEQPASYRNHSTPLKHNKVVRYDRYQNTIPAVFRLTLKGYSIMEHSNNQTDVWTLNKVKNKDLRRPEIMFSVTKRF